jgi:hypothetical protein
MGRQWPLSVVNAQRCLAGLAALMVLATVLTVLMQDRLIESWAEHNPGAREILREGGIEALKKSQISPPAFVPVTLVMLVVLLGLFGVLWVFFREGYAWARLTLGGAGLLVLLGSVQIAFREEPPVVFVVLAVATMLLDVAFLALLAHPDTTAFIHGAWLVHHEADTSEPV